MRRRPIGFLFAAGSMIVAVPVLLVGLYWLAHRQPTGHRKPQQSLQSPMDNNLNSREAASVMRRGGISELAAPLPQYSLARMPQRTGPPAAPSVPSSTSHPDPNSEEAAKASIEARFLSEDVDRKR